MIILSHLFIYFSLKLKLLNNLFSYLFGIHTLSMFKNMVNFYTKDNFENKNIYFLIFSYKLKFF